MSAEPIDLARLVRRAVASSIAALTVLAIVTTIVISRYDTLTATQRALVWVAFAGWLVWAVVDGTRMARVGRRLWNQP